jgi:XRE family aerobic/anaerobic benzoate catabolism transcriptional regulator
MMPPRIFRKTPRRKLHELYYLLISAALNYSADMDSDAFLKELGQRVRSRRHQRGLSQERLAERAGLSPRYLSQLESGRGNISIVRLYELARSLGVPIDELVKTERDRRIVSLIGLRGAGKTTIGKLLARDLKRPFLELDRLIEEEAGLRLSEIFALHGEAYYRRLEREVLGRFISIGRPAILASGGGIITDRVTYDMLKQGTLTVWLKATPEEHLARVAAQGDRRPMAGRADPLAELKSLLREREHLYGEADLVIETSGLSPQEVSRSICGQAEKHLS